MYFEKKLIEVFPENLEILIEIKFKNEFEFLRPREGWNVRGISNGESIYEHTCKIALASYYLFGTKRAVDIGIAHDLAEIYEKDYLPGEIVSGVKKKLEFLSMQRLKFELKNGTYWFDLWQEYNEKSTILSKYISELDKICPAIQALDYMKIYKNNRLTEFYPYARSKLKTPELIKILDEMYIESFDVNENPYEKYFEKLRICDLKL